MRDRFGIYGAITEARDAQEGIFKICLKRSMQLHNGSPSEPAKHRNDTKML